MAAEGMQIVLPVPLVERLAEVLEKLAAELDRSEAPNAGGLLTTRDVAELLQKSTRDVQRLVKAGRLRKVANLGARTTRFRRADVERLAAKGEPQMGGRKL